MERPWYEDERGSHGKRNVRCGHAMENNKRGVKPKVERCVYRRPQMAGQARDEEEKEEEASSYRK